MTTRTETNKPAKKSPVQTGKPVIIEARMTTLMFSTRLFDSSASATASNMRCLGTGMARWEIPANIPFTTQLRYLSMPIAAVEVSKRRKGHYGSLLKKHHRIYHFPFSNRRRRRNVFQPTSLKLFPLTGLERSHAERFESLSTHRLGKCNQELRPFVHDVRITSQYTRAHRSPRLLARVCYSWCLHGSTVVTEEMLRQRGSETSPQGRKDPFGTAQINIGDHLGEPQRKLLNDQFQDRGPPPKSAAKCPSGIPAKSALCQAARAHWAPYGKAVSGLMNKNCQKVCCCPMHYVPKGFPMEHLVRGVHR